MKRILALFLALTLFLPVLSFAELDEEELEFEEFDPDDIPEESSSDSGSIEMTDEMADELLDFRAKIGAFQSVYELAALERFPGSYVQHICWDCLYAEGDAVTKPRSWEE